MVEDEDVVEVAEIVEDKDKEEVEEEVEELVYGRDREVMEAPEYGLSYSSCGDRLARTGVTMFDSASAQLQRHNRTRILSVGCDNSGTCSVFYSGCFSK